MEHLEEVLVQLIAAGLRLKPLKHELLLTEVKYVGHVVSTAAGVASDPG